MPANPIQMLKVLHQRGQVDVTRYDPKTKGFSKDHVRTVRFLDQPPRQPGTPGGTGGLFNGH